MNKMANIQTFILVVEEGSFAGAARQQGLSTAAISRQIAALEGDLKALLLKRTTRRISLTEIGSQYYHQVKKTLKALAEAEYEIISSLDACIGTLKITANRYFALEFLIPSLSEFMAIHPELQVQIELAERFPDLRDENMDLIFGIAMEEAQDWVRLKIRDTRYVLCASPRYLEKHGIPEKPADLARHRYITHSMRKDPETLRFKNSLEMHVKSSLWLNDALAMRNCAILDMGIVNLHDYMVNDALEKGSLIEVLPACQETKQAVYVYYEKSRYLQPKIRHFLDFYRQKEKTPS